jgi:cyclic pyranopterin phosphate synthase
VESFQSGLMAPPPDAVSVASSPVDTRGRPLQEIRISVTDRCNMRCRYCMPREVFGPDYPYLPRADVLTFEEMDRLAGLFAGLGVSKIRLTGGEPLLRRELHKLVSMLKQHVAEVALTTNGVLLPRHAAELAAAGLDRVTVSLDALDEDTFQAMSDSGYSVADVLAGIDSAIEHGLGPVKVNAVVKRGENEQEILALVSRFAPMGVATRFIEYMDVGTSNDWRLDDVVSADEILGIIRSEHALLPIDPAQASEVAKRWRMVDPAEQGSSEIGVIASVSEPFCGDCNRGRLSADGRFFTCLFATEGLDLLTPFRAGASDEELSALIQERWTKRVDAYSEHRATITAKRAQSPRIEMSYIGG